MALEMGSFKRARAGVTAAWLAMTPVAAAFTGASLVSLPASPAHAENVKIMKKTQTVANPSSRIIPGSIPSGEPRPIAEKHCKYLFDFADRTRDAEGEKYLSQTTWDGLAKFFAFGEDELPHCNGSAETRVIPWETNRDVGFIITLADYGTGAFKEEKVDFRKDYGIKPAVRPTLRGIPVGRAATPAVAAAK